jgi:lipopolysaccharide/colanic/teichoic acid biosynthesis glycosyltransferase
MGWRTPDPLPRRRHPPRAAGGIPPAQRAIDILVVLLSLVVVVPLALGIAIAVFLDSPGPVLYRSRRVGRGGRVFAMLKFRTMVRDAGGPSLSCAGDERYTPLGRRLAASRLDELPQLWNVVRGEMRLVGPRPELEDFVAAYAEEYERILSVPPGLTGPAQLEYAWEGEVLARACAVDRARVYQEAILPYKLVIDRHYALARSARVDVVILVRTVLLPLRRFAHRRRLVRAMPGGAVVRRAGAAIAVAATVLAFASVYVIEAAASF